MPKRGSSQATNGVSTGSSAGKRTRSITNLRERIGIVRGIDEEARTVTGYASTGTVDRYGEVVLPEAFKDDLPAFLAERHLFAANHRYDNAAGEPTIIGKVTDAKIDNKGLLATFQFDTDPLSEKWYQKYLSGTLNAFSIGFIPVKWEDREEDGIKTRYYTGVELLEISAVPIPANRESVVTNSMELAEQYVGALEAKIDALVSLGETLKTELTTAFRGLQNDVLGQVGVALARSVPSAGIANDGRKAQGDANTTNPLTRFVEFKKRQRERGDRNARSD